MKGDPEVKITFTDIAEIEKAQEEKKEVIKDKIESGEVVTKPEKPIEPEKPMTLRFLARVKSPKNQKLTEPEEPAEETGGGSTGGGGGGGGALLRLQMFSPNLSLPSSREQNNNFIFAEGATGTALASDFAQRLVESALTITGVSISGESIVLTVGYNPK